MRSRYLAEIGKEDQAVNPLFRALGIGVSHIGEDGARLVMEVAEGHIQGAGVCAGGVLSTLLDEGMAHAAIAVLRGGESTATVDLNIRFLETVRKGDTLTVTARVIRRGGRILHTAADIANQHGALVATGSASFIVLAA